ncbi:MULTISPECIES: glycosyltransferase [Olivibacter]|uniref:Glycosyltransferase n=1 Tax=Olivibacter jilunii TaxID=985016 RepID=A0ABW6BBH6_9SPHI
MKTRIAILQPLVPHYREEFFEQLSQQFDVDIYCYETQKKSDSANFSVTNNISVKYIKSFSLAKFLVFNPLVFLKREYSVVILMLHFGHLTTWFLLLTKLLHKRKIVLWGHGISVKRYLKEEQKPSRLLSYMISLSDSVWYYTFREKAIWEKNSVEKGVSLNNTISGISRILEMIEFDKDSLKKRYKIEHSTVFIYCARFNEPLRRVDILIETIKRLDSSQYGFIIIGEGYLKPDFSSFKNVYDFGAVYESAIKDDLFQLADIYFQPGWVGLSIVEALAYGKPIFTFRRSEDFRQCVEYAYIKDGVNGKLFDSLKEFLEYVNSLNIKDIEEMSKQARMFAKNNLSMDFMVNNAVNSVNRIISTK